MEFAKFSGSGNDFILVDHRNCPVAYTPQAIRLLCDRKRGIGADGLITLEIGQKAPYRMRIFNADGSEAEMCGNGLRCFKRFLELLGVADKSVDVETMHKVLNVSNYGVDIKAEMGLPSNLKLDLELEKGLLVDYVDTGVPHAVYFVSNLDDPHLFDNAPKIRNHPTLSPQGANVNAVKVEGDKVWVRTWERGVEGETLACGTGMVASALIVARRFQLASPITVIPLSREAVTVEFTQQNQTFLEVAQIGPAQFIFQGYCHYAPQKSKEACCC
jgi:diaminopimelate epimerase